MLRKHLSILKTAHLIEQFRSLPRSLNGSRKFQTSLMCAYLEPSAICTYLAREELALVASLCRKP